MREPSPMSYFRPCNALTYGSLLAGFLAALAAASRSGWHYAGALIAFCTLLDTFDGRFARLFPRSADQQAFGCHLDSLADAVVFGFVPVICAARLIDFGAAGTGALVWWSAAAMVYLVATLTRLGCYNLHQSTSNHFVGIPTTLAALLLAALFLMRPSARVTALALAACAVAMSTPIPVPRPRGAGMAAFVLSIVLIIVLHILRAAS